MVLNTKNAMAGAAERRCSKLFGRRTHKYRDASSYGSEVVRFLDIKRVQVSLSYDRITSKTRKKEKFPAQARKNTKRLVL